MRARRAGILLLSLVGCAAAAQALADVKASLDASQIAVGETVQLTLEHDGQYQPVSPISLRCGQESDILGTSSSTIIQLVNGSASEKTQVVLTLAPKITGHLTIPPLSWNGEQSQPLSLDVTGPGGTGQPGAAGAPAAAAVFMETSASPQQPYVEGAVHLTVRLFMAEPLYHANLQTAGEQRCRRQAARLGRRAVKRSATARAIRSSLGSTFSFPCTAAS